MNTIELLYSLMRKLPRFLQHTIIELLHWYFHKKCKQHTTPQRLIFYVTNKCNLSCSHCFYKNNLNTTTQELDLAEIKKIAHNSKGALSAVTLTGGEPFLRNDIPRIIHFFAQSKVKYFSINTNGMLSQQILHDVTKISKNKKIQLSIALSYYPEYADKKPEYHPQFQKLFDSLCTLEKIYKNIFPHVLFTITAKNLPLLPKIYSLFPKDRIKINIYRDYTQNAWDIPNHLQQKDYQKPEELFSLTPQQIDEIITFINNVDLPDTFFHRILLQKLVLIKELQQKRQRILPCAAGYFDSVLYPNGDIALCELTKPLGNIKDCDYSIKNFFTTRRVQDAKKNLTSCSCLLSCNIKSSLLLHKKTLSSLFIHTYDTL